MAKRKPAQHQPPEHYKDAWRHFFVCDKGHRFEEDWDKPFAKSHGRCSIPGCGAWIELDYSGRDAKGFPETYRLVEVPVDHPVYREELRETDEQGFDIAPPDPEARAKSYAPRG